eukprot:COSAG01_NODE_6871_length_3463_cov_17.354637_2_plen_67_part_00
MVTCVDVIHSDISHPVIRGDHGVSRRYSEFQRYRHSISGARVCPFGHHWGVRGGVGAWVHLLVPCF